MSSFRAQTDLNYSVVFHRDGVWRTDRECDWLIYYGKGPDRVFINNISDGGVNLDGVGVKRAASRCQFNMMDESRRARFMALVYLCISIRIGFLVAV